MAAPDTITPASIAQPWLLAFDETTRDKLEGLPVEAVLTYLTDLVPVGALDILISQWGLSGNGGLFGTATEQVKRNLLREAATINARRGTIWALRYMFSVFGMPKIEVIESAGLNIDRYYDGTWFYNGSIPYGFEWHWTQYVIKVYVDSATVPVDAALQAAMELVLLEYAPARCNHIAPTLTMETIVEEIELYFEDVQIFVTP